MAQGDDDESSWKAHRLLILSELKTINAKLEQVLTKEERNGDRLSRVETQIEERAQDKRILFAAVSAIVAAVVSAAGAIASTVMKGQ